MINKILLHALLTLAHLAGSWCFSAEPPTPANFVAVYNDGGTAPGVWYVNANKPWGKVYEEAEQFDFIMLHNPADRTVPMSLDQFARMTKAAAANPNDKDLQAKADGNALVAASIKRTKWEAWYLGVAFEKIPGESARSRMKRAQSLLWMVYKAKPDLVVWDAAKPEPWLLLLIGNMKNYGIPSAIEPAAKTSKEWRPFWNLPVAVQTEFLKKREKGWKDFRNVDLQPSVFELLPGKNVAAEVIAARKAGHVPCINLLKVPSEGVE